MNLLINGESCEAPEGITVAELLVIRHLADRNLAVEVNRQVVPRAEHAEHKLRDGDELEIVSLVGGG